MWWVFLGASLLLVLGLILRAKGYDREQQLAVSEDLFDDEEEIEDEDPEWVSDREYKRQFMREGFAQSGKWARFNYADAGGSCSKRQVVNWEQRGPYIVGFDRSKGEERTFRQDRITDWQAG